MLCQVGARAVFLDCLDRSFDNGNAAVLANGTVAERDLATPVFAPATIAVAVELRSLVRDQIFWFHARLAHQAAKKAAHG